MYQTLPMGSLQKYKQVFFQFFDSTSKMAALAAILNFYQKVVRTTPPEPNVIETSGFHYQLQLTLNIDFMHLQFLMVSFCYHFSSVVRPSLHPLTIMMGHYLLRNYLFIPANLQQFEIFGFTWSVIYSSVYDKLYKIICI